jgi:hypothetical protein
MAGPSSSTIRLPRRRRRRRWETDARGQPGEAANAPNKIKGTQQRPPAPTSSSRSSSSPPGPRPRARIINRTQKILEAGKPRAPGGATRGGRRAADLYIFLRNCRAGRRQPRRDMGRLGSFGGFQVSSRPRQAIGTRPRGAASFLPGPMPRPRGRDGPNPKSSGRDATGCSPRPGQSPPPAYRGAAACSKGSEWRWIGEGEPCVRWRELEKARGRGRPVCLAVPREQQRGWDGDGGTFFFLLVIFITGRRVRINKPNVYFFETRQNTSVFFNKEVEIEHFISVKPAENLIKCPRRLSRSTTVEGHTEPP